LAGLGQVTTQKNTQKFNEKIKKRNVSEIQFDMYRYGMGITFSLKNKDSISDFIKKMKRSELVDYKKHCSWDKIVIITDRNNYILETNGKVFSSDSLKTFYKLNEKYLKHWDGYENCE
jgi:hypothetical protein